MRFVLVRLVVSSMPSSSLGLSSEEALALLCTTVGPLPFAEALTSLQWTGSAVLAA